MRSLWYVVLCVVGEAFFLASSGEGYNNSTVRSPSVSPVQAECTPGLTPTHRTLRGHSALIVVTSHAKLGPSNCSDCKKTGVYCEELSGPYYLFKDAGLNVTIASINGGDVPIDPDYNTSIMQSTSDTSRTGSKMPCCRWADPMAYADSHGTKSIAEVNFSAFDIVFMAGGWGAAWDLGTSDILANGISTAYANEKQYIGSVCHGSLGFINAKRPDGTNVCNGTRMTGVTDKQLDELQIGKLTPLHPQDALIKAGAVYECKHGVLEDITANDVVVDGRIVTGQNQMASCMVPQLLMKFLTTTKTTSEK